MNSEETKTSNVCVEKTKVTKADIVVRGNVNKPYFVIVYNEIGNDYDNEGFGLYNLSNVLNGVKNV